MKNFKTLLFTLLFTALALPHFGNAQDNDGDEIRFKVDIVNPPGSLSKEQLGEAQTISDLDRFYRPAWVREFISVEVTANYNGTTQKATSKNDTLSQEQKDIMKMADAGSDISVKVRYTPENSLKENPDQNFNFAFTVNPASEATFTKGEHQLQQYLKDHAIDKISASSFDKSKLAAVRFSITDNGQIVDIHVFQSCEDEKVDKLLMDTVCNMPSWKPAEYDNGQKVKQEFVLSVGNMESCVFNLLNVR